MARRGSVFKPTPAMRGDVRLQKADGWSDDRIAAQLGVSRTTLLKHFAAELNAGADKVRAEQLRNLARMAKRNVAAAKALLAITDAAPPPPSPKPTEEPKPANLGKKEQRDLDAQQPPPEEWGVLVKH